MGKQKDCCYEEMTKGKIYEDSEETISNPPYENNFETSIPYSNGYDQSGMKGK